MREIKFQVWDKHKKSIYEVAQIDWKGQKVQANTGEWLRNENKGDGKMVLDGERFSLMQFTGLLDKNGVEIYEGDIVKQDFMGIIGYVKFVEKDGAYKLIANRVGDAGFMTNFTDDWEVIGNTFENPENF